MRLREMTLSGIGPFAGTEHIDFTAFEASGLFLLEGPTGAGKSTIIDALTFALYGDVARQRDSSKDRLRSSYCDPGDPSVVDLVFEVPAGVHRVRRTPQFVRPGRKTAVTTTVHLERVAEGPDGGFITVEPISRSVGEADAEIARLVGLTKDQFLQTVVLPQGKFAGFLTAKSEDRQAILSDIFDAGIFEDLQQVLRDRARDAETAVDAAESGAREALTTLTRVTALEGAEDDHALDLDALDFADTGALCASVDAAVEAVRGRAEEHARAVDPLSRHEDEAEAALAQGRATEQALTDLGRQHELLDRLTDEAPAIETARHRVAGARRAEPVRSSLDRDRRAATARIAANMALDTAMNEPVRDPACAAFSQPLLDLTRSLTRPLTSEGASDLRDRTRSLREDVVARRTAAASLLELEAALADRQAALDAEGTDLDALRTRLEDARERERRLPSELARTREQVEADTALASGLEALTVTLDDLERRLEATQRADLLRASLTERAEEVQAAAQRAQLAGALARDAHDRWLHATAASLAVSLVEGEACPVCGSEQHPAPAAEPEGGALTIDQVDALAEDQREADRTLEQARQEHTDTVRRIAALTEQAGTDSSFLEERVAHVRADIGASRDSSNRVRTGHEAITKLTTRWDTTRAEVAELSAHVVETETRLEASRMQLDADKTRCAEAAAPMESLAALDAALTHVVSRIDELVEVLESRDRAEREAATARTDLRSAVARAGFSEDGDGIADATEALLDPEDVAALDERVTRHDRAVLLARDALDSPRLREVEGVSHPDLEALQADADLAKHAHAQALRTTGQWESRLGAARGARTEFTARLAALSSARTAAAPARRLAGLASATSPENLLQTPLASWVLISRFEDVLAAANPRLLEISEGRYELHRTLSDDTRSRKAGLGLEIIDHDTDQARAPRTLSGGETFYASLALALGLADVVTAEAGGIELRMMFIDEGFGSLDTGKLDAVMSQLGALRDSGRTVGVISHVDEMARRIPDQINVRWNPRDGSTLSVRV